MTEVTIYNVPEGMETEVKIAAMACIEQYLKRTTVKMPDAVQQAFEDATDVVRVANGLDKKFLTLEEKEAVKVVPIIE